MTEDLQAFISIEWVIDGPKIKAYLLNLAHPDGASKAKYLFAFGFTLDDPQTLANALVNHATINLPGKVKQQKTGLNRVVFEGNTPSPDGRMMPLRTVWEVCPNSGMRFITAVPLTR